MSRVRSYDNIGINARSLDYAMLRHSILSDNIANIDTPGFKRSDVSFVTELRRALEAPTRIEMKRTADRHFETQPTRDIDKVAPKVYAELDTWTRNDHNNVDPEVEMAHIAQNVMYYQTVSGRLAGSFRTITGIIAKTPS